MTPIRLYASLAILVALVLIGAGIGCKYQTDRLEKARASAARSADDATGRGLEVQGERATGAAVAAAQTELDQARTSADALNSQARADPAASGQLPASVRDRVRAGDGQLCGRAACR